MNKPFIFFATAPKGLELLLVEELRALGAINPAEKLAGVLFSGDLALAYKACLWSRLANRILLRLKEFPAATAEALYSGIQDIAWDEHLKPDGTLSVRCVCSQSSITHSLYAAQKAKDAIVDQLRQKYGVRPTVLRHEPQINVHIYLHRDRATISLDLSGESLHKRGYRLGGGQAPLKENLAAALLLRAQWPALAKTNCTLLDPMCGSGTLLIEAAMLAGNSAPGLARHYFGFLGWQKHQPHLWQDLLQDAAAKREKGLLSLPMLVGYDHDASAIKMAFENIERAGLRGHIHVEKRPLATFAPLKKMQPGLVILNPPYGERLGEIESLKPLYSQIGEQLKQNFVGWRAAVLTGNSELGKQMGLRAERYYSLFNGALPCKLLLFDVQPAYFVDRSQAADNERRIRRAQHATELADREAVQMFVNRLRKNLKHLKRKAQQSGTDAYRVYDADIPEYAFAIDIAHQAVYVQEYQAPKKMNQEKVSRRQQAVLAVLPELLELPPAQIFFSVIPREQKRSTLCQEK